MNVFTRILEKLFNLERYQEPGCQSCDHLRLLIEQERRETDRLISHIISITGKKEEASPVQVAAPQPIKPRHVPWGIRAAELSALDRKAEAIRKEKIEEGSISIKDLEDEIAAVNKEIENDNKNDAASNEDNEHSEEQGKERAS